MIRVAKVFERSTSGIRTEFKSPANSDGREQDIGNGHKLIKLSFSKRQSINQLEGIFSGLMAIFVSSANQYPNT